jgi:hypothetical protein
MATPGHSRNTVPETAELKQRPLTDNYPLLVDAAVGALPYNLNRLLVIPRLCFANNALLEKNAYSGEPR